MLINSKIHPDIKVRKIEDLVEIPTIVKVSSFTDDGVRSFVNSIEKANNGSQTVIPIVIDSFGGQVYSLLAMVDALQSVSKPIVTVAQGKAMSCGAVLFTCGTEGMRFMSPNSTLMIHDVSSVEFGKVEEVKVGAAESDRLNNVLYSLMAKNIGKPDKYFWDIVQSKGRADWFLTADEAKTHNIANHIRIPKMNFRVEVTSELV